MPDNGPTIVTLTMNPALDLSTRVEQLRPEHKLRCTEPVREPGGGGINVARAVRKLGGDALAVFPAGGDAGESICLALDAEGVPFSRVPIAGRTRENINVWDQATGRHYRLCLPGPLLRPEEVQECLGRLRRLRPAPTWVVASGSLPPGADAGFYAELGREVRAAGAHFVLDAAGEPLRLAVRAGVSLIKPSLGEFEELTGARDRGLPELLAAARALVASGAVDAVVLSLGVRGVIWASRDDAGGFAPPLVTARSSVGAGDSLLAGVVLSLLRGLPLAQAVRFGVAAAAAAVMNPGTALCRAEDAERLLPEVVPLRFDESR